MKTADYKMSSRLKRIKSEPIDLLKAFDRCLADEKSHLEQSKTASAERAYPRFFETYENLEKKRQQQRQLVTPKYLESFDADTERKRGERKKKLWCLVEQLPNLREFE